ncbi:proton-conducting transporter membrane subunit [Clostridium sp. D53t1_180928_C8]|uniref:proton-conducting transporter transmembrane domain-containing protein n=1 Tax=Clostridium sp. D53t1_180928_C8 TaxID=2787101 RepID=UPI0018AA8E1D|nr:proton-conducting transporter membrane subunit [Clostridium sp. D53t1_180928_C8]
MSIEFINNLPIIAIMTPFVLAFVLGLFKDKYIKVKRTLAVIATAVSFVCVILLVKPILINGEVIVNWMGNWIPMSGSAYGIGLEIDSLGVFLALIITGASLLSVVYSLKYMSHDNGLEKYYVLFLLLTSSMIGFVFTGDLFNMYVMLEIMTFAAIALTAFRNYKDKSVEAAFKYIVTGSLGSSLILLGTCLVYSETKTLNLAEIAAIINSVDVMSPTIIVAFSLMMVGYAVKAFMVPCHTWPTDAHMAAPSSISMILSGVMSKTGVYAIIRLVFMIFGLASNKPVGYLILVWGVITMVIGVSMALLQHDFKRLLAFHSVSQIGYIITALGIAIVEIGELSVLAMTGGTYHMINHAIFKGLLFLTAGAILYTTGTTDLESVSGLGKRMPFTLAMFLFGAAGISGIPPFNGFASKWMIYEAGFSGSLGIVSIIAVVVSALTLASFIKVGHSAFFGPVKSEYANIEEIPISMKIPMGILALGTVIFGLFPKTVVNNLLLPVVKSIYNLTGYIFEALGNNYNLGLNANKIVDVEFLTNGIYNPTNFLILFVVLLIAILVFVIFKSSESGEEMHEKSDSEFDMRIFKKYENHSSNGVNYSQAPLDSACKYDIYVGGEEGENVKIGANDLFWGMKYQLKGYFNKIQKAHSGSVNDYSLWIIVTLVIVCVITIIIL